MTHAPKTCKWPVGRTGKQCGAPVESYGSYCEKHRIPFEQSTDRRRPIPNSENPVEE